MFDRIDSSQLTQLAAQPTAPTAPTAPSWQHRAALMAINGVLFQTLYSACNVAAARAGVTRNIATAWDAAVPFLPWMLVPYMTSVPLLMMAFMFTPGRQSLRALSQRCMLATVLGTLVFALWPLHISIVRPPSNLAVLQFLSDMLQRLDAPYNQWPSLHVAYCMLVWAALRERVSASSSAFSARLGRIALAVWLMLVAVSTVVTHQHYLADFAGGLLLGALALWAVPSQRKLPWVSLHYAVAATAALVLGLTVLPWPLGVWLGVSLAVCFGAVACAYVRDDTNFLYKRDGSFPWWVYALYGPYLMGYRMTWWWVRWKERGKPAFVQFADGLWVGRRLTESEAEGLPANCAVIDLAAELSETRSLSEAGTVGMQKVEQGLRYQSFGLLDLMPPPARVSLAVARAIDAELAQGRPVYLHCAMGYRRGREVAAVWQANRTVSLTRAPSPSPAPTPAPARTPTR